MQCSEHGNQKELGRQPRPTAGREDRTRPMLQHQISALPHTDKMRARPHGAAAAAAAVAKVVPAAAGLALVEAAIGYEWLLSGLNKVLSSGFGSGLAHQLQTSLQGNPNRWVG